MSRRIAVGASVAAAVVVAAVVLAMSLSRPGDDPDGPAATTGDEDGGPGDDAEADELTFDGPETSAATGPEGTRHLDQVPDDLPDELLVADAEDVAGMVARAQADWSATLTYWTSLDRDTLVEVADGALGPRGFTQRSRSSDERQVVVVYDGEDGSIVTVTVRDDEARTSFHAVRVSP